MTTSETKHRRRAGLTNAARRGLHAAREDTPDPDAVHGLPHTTSLSWPGRTGTLSSYESPKAIKSLAKNLPTKNPF